MSGQPSGNPSGPRPTTNGVGTSSMTSSQQRSDPQVGSSTSNGQSGSMSQSNLNSIVRQRFSCSVLSALHLSEAIACLLLVTSVPEGKEHRDSISKEAARFWEQTATSLSQTEVAPFRICRTNLLARCCCRAWHQHFKC